jgi:hypothetical protein
MALAWYLLTAASSRSEKAFDWTTLRLLCERISPLISLRRASGFPKWSFRKPSKDEIKNFSAILDELLHRNAGDGQADPVNKGNLTKYGRELIRCANCKFWLCDDENTWVEMAKGPEGEPGYGNRSGGKGGRAGNSGTLKIYYFPGNQQAEKKLVTNFNWWDRKSIYEVPTDQIGGEGGPAGKPGEGQQGGQGLAESPFGACPAGKSGANGPDGPKNASPGDPGDKPTIPAHSAETGPLTGFPANPRD